MVYKRIVDYHNNINRLVKNECKTICTIVRKNVHKRKIKDSDYPGCVVVCKIRNHSLCCVENSHIRYNYSQVRSINNKLLDCGQIGVDKVNNNIIGACAEPNAAFSLLKDMGRFHQALHTLCFSMVLRPRTKQIEPSCPICTHVFPQLIIQ